jgi:hypothetical protein
MFEKKKTRDEGKYEIINLQRIWIENNPIFVSLKIRRGWLGMYLSGRVLA